MMGIRFDRVRSLAAIDLSAVNPTFANRLREKNPTFYNAHPEQFTRDVVKKQHLRSILLMLVIYVFFFLPIPFDLLPSVFDTMYAMLMVLTIMQSVTTFFSLFYESDTIRQLMSLPVRPQEVFAARTIVASLSVAAMAVTLLPLFFFFFFNSGIAFPLCLLWSLFFGVLSFWLVLGGNFIVMQLLLRIQQRKRIRPAVLSLMSSLITMASIVVLIIVNTRSQNAAQSLQKNHIIEPGPISGLLLDPAQRLLSAAVLLAVSLLLLFWVYRRVMLRFYDYLYSLQGRGSAAVEKKTKTKASAGQATAAPRSLRKTLWRYNRQLIDNQTIVSTSILSPGMLPFIMFLPMFLNNDIQDIRALAADPAAAALLLFSAGIALAVIINVWFNALPSVIVSLDGANFDYIRTLPFSMHRYLHEKWLFSALFSAIVPLLLCTAAAIYAGLWPFLPAAILTFAVTHLILSRAWLVYDLKNLNTSWSAVSDLYLRNNKGIGMAMVFFGMIVAGGLLFGTYYMNRYLGTATAFALIGGSWLIVCALAVFLIQRNLTRRLNQSSLL